MSETSSSKRAESLTGSTRLLYGLGLAGEGVKNNAFNMFLLFYYQQVVGLPPILTGLALFFALTVDALVDPLVGAWSDGFVSRYGRRHPFMYAGTLPLGVCFYMVFTPPAGASRVVLFAWLAAFACGTRVAMALFVIPHQSLVAELTESYDQRTRLQSLRVVFAWLFGLLNALLAYTVFLKAGGGFKYNPKGFPAFALWGACAMFVTTLASALGTQRAALRSHAGRVGKHVRLSELVREIRSAFASPNYRAAVAGGLLGAVGFGLAENMGNYMNLFFWGFEAQELAVFIAVIALASIVVLGLSPRLSARYGKGRVAVYAAVIGGSLTPLMVGLRLAGALPSAGSPELRRILCVAVFFGYAAVITGFVMVGAMIADVTDEHELRTGARQEGLLFSAMMFISKAASGLSPLLAGAVIQLSGFPENARPEAVDPAVVRNLGAFVALFSLAVGVLTALAYARYRLTRNEHERILLSLEQRRAAPAE